MGWCVIKQETGKYSIWSTVVNAFFFVNGTKKHLINHYKKNYNKKVATEQVNDLLKDKIKMTIEDALNNIKIYDGKEKAKKVIKIIATNKYHIF